MILKVKEREYFYCINLEKNKIEGIRFYNDSITLLFRTTSNEDKKLIDFDINISKNIIESLQKNLSKYKNISNDELVWVLYKTLNGHSNEINEPEDQLIGNLFFETNNTGFSLKDKYREDKCFNETLYNGNSIFCSPKSVFDFSGFSILYTSTKGKVWVYTSKNNVYYTTLSCGPTLKKNKSIEMITMKEFIEESGFNTDQI